MKDLTKLFLFSILFFSPIISCKNNKDNSNFISAEKTSKNSVENEMITVEEINERLNFNNPEVKEYFKPFYDKLEKMDLEKPTPEDQIKLFYETIKVLDEEYYFNIFDFDYTPSDELTKTFHIWQNEGPLRIKLLNNLWIVLSLECRISSFFLY